MLATSSLSPLTARESPDPRAKRLIVCADGTWNDEDAAGAPTNVAKLHAAVQTRHVEGVEQLVHYQSGVGTRMLERFVGGAFGVGLSRNIKECYAFLVDNYVEGDEIFLFGFSRGAYTVRSLAGLIRNSGIVAKRADIDRAFAMYRSRRPSNAPDGHGAIEFRRRHAKPAKPHPAAVDDEGYLNSPEIKFIGVWDTVGALGVPLPGFAFWKRVLPLFGISWWFFDTDLSTTVRYAYHAVSIHERRSDFQPTLWKQQAVEPANQPEGAPQAKRSDQVLQQVYFAGVHSDVGGGYGASSLSDVAFCWMLAKAEAAGLRIRPQARVPGVHLAPNPLGMRHESFQGLFVATDAVRLRPRGVQRTFPRGPEYRARISDSTFLAYQHARDARWPEAGGDDSIRSELGRLDDGAGAGTASVLKHVRALGDHPFDSSERQSPPTVNSNATRPPRPAPPPKS
ncbi:MAG TPA: DUF2235 domain-containing protein [Polyangiaceae bacterium]|nr:DUF2235 domain-containing protein [Polyangiaceae bacterium]